MVAERAESDMTDMIAITGAGGRMATALRKSFQRDGTSVVLLSRSAVECHDNERVLLGDLSDYSYVRESLKDIDLVVHLGGKADESDFSEILSSKMLGTYNVFESARVSQVRRVVYASSHHVTGFRSAAGITRVADAVQPDTFYGVSKVFGEALGRLYADKWGLEVVCLRIGVCRPEPENTDQLRTWLSVPDSIRLVRAAATHELADGFVTVYGVSNNTAKFWDTGTAAQIGFQPQDSADDYRDRYEPDPPFSTKWQGGAF